MTANMEILRKHAVGRLDAIGREHPKGHQMVHARRYLVGGAKGEIEVAIIVKDGTALQIWLESAAVSHAKAGALGLTFRPGAETYSRQNEKGETLYGRHSSLKAFDRMHRGDAWHSKPMTTGEFDRILDELMGMA